MTIYGDQCKLYYNTGTYAAPVWTEVNLARDLTLELDSGESEITVRSDSPYRSHVASLHDSTVTTQLRYSRSDTTFLALQTAFQGRALVDMAVMDGEILAASIPTGQTNRGLRARWAITNFTRNEPLGEHVMTDMSLRPSSDSDGGPEWMEVAGSGT